MQMPIGGLLDRGARWPDLANTIEPSVCGGDAALFMAALCNKTGHIYFHLEWFLSIYLSFFFSSLISAATDWMSTILLHMAWP